MHRRFLTIASALVVVLAACSPGGSTSASPDSTSVTPASPGASPAASPSGEGIAIDEAAVSGTVRLSGWRSSESEEKLLTETIAAFEAAYPNVKVDYEPIPEGYIDQMTAQFSAGEPPDVFYVQAEFSDAWMEDGLLEPLDPYFAGNPEFTTEPFYDQLLSVFQLDGKTYGLPKDAGPLALFYNTDLLTAANVQPPTTWDELTAAAKTLTKDGVAGLCVGPELPRVGAFIYQAGGGIYNADNTELTITAPESVAGIDYYLQLHSEKALQTPAELGAGWCGEAFGQGKAAMTMEGTWLFPPLENDFPDIKYAVAELPQGTQQGNLAFTNAYGMGVDSANKEAGWVLLQYLAGPEGMGKWTSMGLALPAREDVDPPAERDAHIAGLTYGTAYAFGRDFADIQTAFNNELTRVIAEGGTGQEIADAAAAAAQ
ncbi:MAG: transporter substrate-binding protein [Chloroflexota bacterium]|nr:transporter substrate-binding protein [Chloroflexota bacterium]